MSLPKTATPANAASRVRRGLRNLWTAEAKTTAFLPLLLATCSITGLLVFQVGQLSVERGALADLRANQQPAFKEAQRLQAQLEGVAGDTARLAEDGNPNAVLIINGLRARGITINPNPSR